MHMPTKAQFKTVIDNLTRVMLEFNATSDDNLNMMESHVNGRHVCGTVHCIGGWYALATLRPFVSHIAYTDGAHKMAEDLGFKDALDLKQWARHNPAIWGNRDGDGMFCVTAAYNGATNLPEAIQHLESVMNRLPS